MAIELCLFDLDNTLLRTSDLEDFRGRENLGNTSAVYTRRLLAAFGGGRTGCICELAPAAYCDIRCPIEAE